MRLAAHGDAIESEGIEVGDVLGGHAADGISREGEGVELESTIALKPQDGGELLLCRGEAEGADAHVVDGERTCCGEVFCAVARQTNESIVA